MDLNITKENLKKFNQEHLLDHYEQLNEREQQNLLNDIRKVCFESFFEQVEKCQANKSTICEELQSKTYELVKHPKIDLNLFGRSKDEKEKIKLLGMKAIVDNEMAIVLLAGGQSKRLSISYPKGTYSIGLLSQKSLFQLQAERLVKIKQLALKRLNLAEPQSSGSIPWYIMTSECTHQETVEFFEEHQYFGLNKSDVRFFQQKMLPCLDKFNKLILKTKYSLCKAPNGSGGLYEALLSNQILDDMRHRGVKYVHIYFVDNVLVKMADPLFTGACIQNEWQCAAKVT
jgi:UDP-N-acetylglucosamine/UDP-N-acetylgalactosamine diphosphorylase